MEIEAIYNIHGDTSTCFVVEDPNGGHWYAFDGSNTANFTYDELFDGVDATELNDQDVMTMGSPVGSLSDLQREVDDLSAVEAEHKIGHVIKSDEDGSIYVITEINQDPDGIFYNCEGLNGEETSEFIREEDVSFYAIDKEEAIKQIEEMEIMEEKEVGFSARKLMEMGLDVARKHKLGLEFNGVYTPELEQKLKDAGMEKTWGHEGFTTSYAVFRVDNPDHSDYNKNMISLYSTDYPSAEEILGYKKKQYIMDAINCTDYSEEIGEIDINDQLTTKGKLQYVANSLNGEAFDNYNMNKHKGNLTKIVRDHLQGLPSYLNIDFENFKILEKGKEWGVNLTTEEKEDQFLEQWFDDMGKNILELMDENGIDPRGDNQIFERKEENDRSIDIDNVNKYLKEQEEVAAQELAQAHKEPSL